jgi:hypothetical protein
MRCESKYKRLEAGTFQIPAGHARAAGLELDATELSLLLAGVELASVKRRKRYRRAVSAPTRDVISTSA